MNTPKSDDNKKSWKISGMSRSALLQRRSTPISDKLLIKKTSLSTPRTSSGISKINNNNLISKKKLEFAARKIVKDQKCDKNYDNLSVEDLQKLIDERKEKLEVLKRHEAEKKELTELTMKWKKAGNEGLDFIESHLKLDREEIMRKIKVDKELFL